MKYLNLLIAAIIYVVPAIAFYKAAKEDEGYNIFLFLWIISGWMLSILAIAYLEG